jgi:hypothetical protein
MVETLVQRAPSVDNVLLAAAATLLLDSRARSYVDWPAAWAATSVGRTTIVVDGEGS